MKLMSVTLKTLISAVSLSMPLLIVAQTDPLSIKHGVYVEKREQCKGAPKRSNHGLGWRGLLRRSLQPLHVTRPWSR